MEYRQCLEAMKYSECTLMLESLTTALNNSIFETSKILPESKLFQNLDPSVLRTNCNDQYRFLADDMSMTGFITTNYNSDKCANDWN
jgi:hypothetical protein